MIRILIFISLLLVPIVGCGPTAEQRAARSLSVDDVEFVQRENGRRELRGRVVNPADLDIEGLQVEIGLYDANNRRTHTVQVPVRSVLAKSDTSFVYTLDTDEKYSGARVQTIRLY